MDRQTHSLWMETKLPSLPALQSNLETEVCIVGGGITGLTCAYSLIKQGKKVVIIDKGPFTCGQTVRTTAHLTWLLDTRFHELETLFSENQVALAANSHASAIDYIENNITKEGIDCDFERVDGYFFASPKESPDIVEKEYEAVHKFNQNVQKISKPPLETLSGPCLHIPRQAQFHIEKYLTGLLKFILAHGGHYFNHTEAKNIQDGTPCEILTTSGVKITAQAVIIATCTPINDRILMHTKQAAYRTYVIGALVPKGTIPKGLYWDTEDPYHYVRLQNHQTDSQKEWLIVGGEDHRTGQDSHINSKYRHLEDWAKERFPVEKIDWHWSGQVFEPFDGLAFIGRNPMDNHVYIATGTSGNGITYGTIAGMLISDLILGKENPWKNLYDPARKTLKAAPKYVEELLSSSYPYLDWMTPGDKENIKNLSVGEGTVIRKGIKKLAVYKDLDNKLHINSAFCPHLGGCVRWNPGEKSWDCPCHGSRFNGEGEVITGPANGPLFPSPGL